MKRFDEYEKWLNEKHAASAAAILGPLSISAAGSAAAIEPVEVGPFLTSTVSPNRPPWQMIWAVIFDDGYFFRVTENWFSRRGTLGFGALREHFSFQYGKTPPGRDADGIPIRDYAYPTVFRIDCDRTGPHLHLGNMDHIPQARVSGMNIIDADPFEYVEAVMKHRKDHLSFEDILNFRVKT